MRLPSLALALAFGLALEAQPSGEPSFLPTSEGRPTGAPSRRTGSPSALPFAPESQPSGEPSFFPTSEGRPTGAPSAAFLFEFPTQSPSSGNVSNSSTTSVNITSSPLYRSFLADLASSSAAANAISFSYFSFAGRLVVGGFSQYRSFLANSLALPFDNYFFASIVAVFARQQALNRTYVTANCSNSEPVSSIVRALREGSSVSVQCGGHLWSTGTCQGVPSLCLNGTDPCSAEYPLSPTIASSTVSMFGLIVLEVGFVPLYPGIVSLNVTALRTSVLIESVLSAPGQLACGAFSPTSPPLSIAAIQDAGYSNVTSVGGILEILELNINGLFASTSYTIYCFTQDFAGHSMNLSTALSTGTEVVTECCPAIVLANPASVLQPSQTTSESDTVFIFALDSPVMHTVTVSADLFPFPCGYSVTSSSLAYAQPAKFSFGPNSSSLQGSFVLVGQSGCFEVTLSATGIIPASFNVSILAANAPPAPPYLQSAVFSYGGHRIVLYFNADTDRAQSVVADPVTLFNCSLVLSFPGAQWSSCLWLLPSQLQATLTTSATVSPGSLITLLNGTVRASCNSTSCPSYAYAKGQSILVQPPSSALVPVVSLSVSAEVNACEDAVIDPTASFGGAGRGWSTVVWNCSDEAIGRYLNYAYPSGTDSIVVVPNGLLQVGATYVIALQLRNFLGGSGAAQVSFQVTDATLSARISGAVPASFNTAMALSLTATVSFPTCVDPSSVSLQFAWRVFDGVSYQQAVQSTSPNPRLFTIPPYTLSPLTTYTVSVAVTVFKSGSYRQAYSSSTTVVVGSAGVFVSIAGGRRTISPKLNTIDASASRNLDHPSCGVSCLTLIWSCLQTAPVFGGNCSMLTLRPGNGVLAVDFSSVTQPTTFSFTVVGTSTNSSATGSDSVLIDVRPAVLPLVAVTNVATKYDPTSKIVLTGTVSANGSGISSWSTNISLEGRTLSPLSSNFSSGTSPIALAIAPNTLTPGLTYPFTLQAQYILGEGNVAASTVQVVINAPPINGVVLVSPNGGLAFNTSFLVSTSSWSDDPGRIDRHFNSF